MAKKSGFNSSKSSEHFRFYVGCFTEQAKAHIPNKTCQFIVGLKKWRQPSARNLVKIDMVFSCLIIGPQGFIDI